MNPVQVCLPFLGERRKKGGEVPFSLGDGLSALPILFLASCSVWLAEAQTEFKRVAEENVTLPCHHRLGLLEQGSLDIEWLLHTSESVQKAVGSTVTCWENSPTALLLCWHQQQPLV